MGSATATAHLVGIDPDAKSTDNRRKVKPHKTEAISGDEITITNNTDDLIMIQFADDTLFEKNDKGVELIRLDSGASEILTVPTVDVETTCYYAIFCMGKDGTSNFAHGSSMPIIIVQPKSE